MSRVRASYPRPNESVVARQFNVARKIIQRDLADLVKRGQIDPTLYPEWNSTGGAE